MKKILFILMAVLTLGFTSCKDSYEIVDPGTQTTPAQDMAGTYNGTWTCEIGSNGDNIVTAPGSLTFNATAAYNADLHIVCNADDKNVALDVTAPANVNPTYLIYNGTKTHDLGSPFTGQFDVAGKKVTLTFQINKKSGLRTTVYLYKFEGSMN